MKRLIKTYMNPALLILVFALVFTSCDEEIYVREVVESAPTIASFSPNSGLNGTLITVKGDFLKNVESASFGDSEAVIYRIINNNELVLKVTNASKSGAVTLVNSKGTAKSADEFTMQYVVPTATEWPSEGEINQDVSITGTNLQSVTKVYFTSIGNTTPFEAKIVFQQENEMALQVPYVEADWENVDNTRATLTMVYNTEADEQTVQGPTYAFTAIKPDFEVLQWPTAVLKNSQVTILGTNINLTDSVFFGNEYAPFVPNKKTPFSIMVQVPDFSERSFVNMRVVYFKTLVVNSPVSTEVYTKFRKTLGNFEGGISSMVLHPDRIAPETEWELLHSIDTPLVAAEGAYYASYYSSADAVNKSSVPVNFAYNEGEGNTINLNAFEDPVLHFYYFNDSTPAYLQLEIVVGGTKMRVYIERYRTNKQNWELVCVRLKDAQFGPGYDGPFGPLNWKDTYEELRINFKPDEDDDIQVHLDNVFVSEGAIKGAIDLTRHTKEFDKEISIVE